MSGDEYFAPPLFKKECHFFIAYSDVKWLKNELKLLSNQTILKPRISNKKCVHFEIV